MSERTAFWQKWVFAHAVSRVLGLDLEDVVVSGVPLCCRFAMVLAVVFKVRRPRLMPCFVGQACSPGVDITCNGQLFVSPDLDSEGWRDCRCRGGSGNANLPRLRLGSLFSHLDIRCERASIRQNLVDLVLVVKIAKGYKVKEPIYRLEIPLLEAVDLNLEVEGSDDAVVLFGIVGTLNAKNALQDADRDIRTFAAADILMEGKLVDDFGFLLRFFVVGDGAQGC